ncbi:thioredoxin-like protein [Trichocladium antarcticum]|uniref:Thioredoxin-like protein n=1 Tax=Trichocladium antarcticum TaxID=1450529 RepID=A0AAN6UQH1_9PEZI|nr:thioredoxin-like protein [Trichocladium antarcticum]
MSDPTPAQEEFAAFLDKNNRSDRDRIHPEDRDFARSSDEQSEDEEDRYRSTQIDAAMRMPTMDAHNEIRLPPASFDRGRSTGVKGVIADARSYETARRTKWKDRVSVARRSMFGLDGGAAAARQQEPGSSDADSDGSGAEDPDEEAFIRQWRESRKRELEEESRNPVRNRRTSPSIRLYGRFDQVDALGYLDAIEKVGRETVVVVFVYDPQAQQSDVSAAIQDALVPLVSTYPAVHFVRVHYEAIEFDNAGVPAILAYRNQGDLFANLTGILEMFPDDDDFDTDSVRKLFLKHKIL